MSEKCRPFRSGLMCSFEWRHIERDGVSTHQPHDCLLKSLFRCKSKETSKLRVTGLCEWNSPVAGEFPAQRASNAENVSIWWCHHVINGCAITMTSHARHGESNHRQIYCFAQQLVQASNKGNIKVFLTAGPFMRRNRRWLVDSFTRGQQCGQHFHIMTSYFFSLPDITSWLSSCRTTLRWSGQNGKIT